MGWVREGEGEEEAEEAKDMAGVKSLLEKIVRFGITEVAGRKCNGGEFVIVGDRKNLEERGSIFNSKVRMSCAFEF